LSLEAVVLAAGRGSRLNPLTEIVPKALLRLPGGSLIDHIIRNLMNVDLQDIYIVCGHLGDDISKYVNRHYPRCKIVEQVTEIGTAADGLLAIRDYVKGDFLVVHGDHFFSENPFVGTISRHIPGTITLLVQDAKMCSSFGYCQRCLYDPATSEISYALDRLPQLNSGLIEGVLVDGCMILPKQVFDIISDSRADTENQTLEMRHTLTYIARHQLCRMEGFEISGWWANINDFATFGKTLKRLNEFSQDDL
jgi:NDP-sugar pyrophosphorylase family protein